MDILVAEDHYVSRLLLQKTLKQNGYRVREAQNGEIAWQAVQAQRPQILITDWEMPEKDGVTLCRQIRALESREYIYIIVLTSRDTMTDLVEVFDAGADDYIIKPFKKDELIARVRTGERLVALESRHIRLQAELLTKNRELDQTLDNLKKTQVQMLHSEKMASIGQLSAGIAHEINNPIGFIGSNLEALTDYMGDVSDLVARYRSFIGKMADDAAVPDTVSKEASDLIQAGEEKDIEYLMSDIPELLNDCRDGTRRVADIVRDLKLFASPGNDKKMPMDINAGMQTTLNVVHNELKYKASIHKDFGELPRVEGYPRQVNQVFMNLLVNAAQAIDQKGEIHIKTYAEQGQAVIVLSDTGCGITQENLTRIFDPFFTTREVGSGAGLGLTMAFNIVRDHKGSITVESQEGEGTCFTVTLPGMPDSVPTQTA